MSSILSLITLDKTQHDAVTQRGADVIVTAGAGSGKTRTLVARFLSLVEEGAALRALIAITFTDKAAREMRTRIRGFIERWRIAPDNDRRELWQTASADLDSARIGTIHSLCATILRAHPAEAGLDPSFEVLDENQSAAFRAQAIDAALTWAASDADAVTLFALLKENALREILSTLIEKSSVAMTTFDAVRDPLAVWQNELAQVIARYTQSPDARDAFETLDDLRARGELAKIAGDKLAAQLAPFFENWDQIENGADWNARLHTLSAMRSADLSGKVGSKGAAKDAVKILREAYDEWIKPWLSDTPNWSFDVQVANAIPQLRRVFEIIMREYGKLKAERRALDFDDLEARTVALLESNADVRVLWQTQTRAVLVDEFQDTNDQQRRIIYALSGFGFRHPASRNTHLFIVGDGKQSIYRFRGGDVTVLRRVQNDLQASGGVPFDLDVTYRAHKPLVDQMNDLLKPILGTTDDPNRPYAIPFSPLTAHRTDPRAQEPFVEFCLGLGENADEGRAATANALAARLQKLRDEEKIDWGEMALLFRASTHFADYESAFERVGIPFITVAGKGFYERPEVRDLFNALAAIADPTDDLAIAGVLRSPAFGLTDAALYHLRRDQKNVRSFWLALQSDLSMLTSDDVARAQRAREILGRCNQLAGRVSVAAVLKYFLDATDYRAILQSVLENERPRRNVDKLLADAHASSLVSISEFLEYVQTLRDVEAREGEAPVEAGKSVQLMTVHKAKGLEFPVVVLADAAHSFSGGRNYYLDPKLGVVFGVKQNDERSVMIRLAALRDQDQDDAESRRLLYVAATRAKEKLIVCGPTRRKTDGTLTLTGWLEQLGAVVGLDMSTIAESLTAPIEVDLSKIACRISPFSESQNPNSKIQIPISQSPISNLVAPLPSQPTETADDKTREHEAEPPPRVWRVVPVAQRPRGPAWVVGKLVHEAIQRWRFPDHPDFKVFLQSHALAMGLIDAEEISASIAKARRLLERFQAHELYAEMDRAERYHELPYTHQGEGHGDTGVIDVLYRAGETWRVVDFKTDEIRDEEKLREKDQEYREQLRRYSDAVKKFIGATPQASMCFLDVRGAVRVVSGD